ncbi:Flagellar basal-body rod protein FlgG [Paenibacillus polymyxa E681]|uniref:flagellar basal body rod protein FlgG n=1 Tax=Paenibacillus polymyxa TaxID=1406 RepID=UPI0001E31596|nr:flagellar basal body rod protein FlgG [Paenibacillus polymyxa]ADM69728.1 flagellar basal body rod protein FlgG [Paenibacillus polymyxa E681]QNV56748.1 Flagellar basal-body rod protein FlgG [Paenibacillus polymyxa E681]QNV61585.1 Flagellar basal-body rod protein FlgG [Paenibacillus polymyxa E681]
MLRSMYSGVSGMKGFQTKLDVIGNNIANVNTTGFKSSRVMFKDILSQTSSGASAPGDAAGGINAKQVGLGSTVGSIDTLHLPGSAMTTNNPTDLRINGDGFFLVKMTGDQEVPYLTRAGDFHVDGNRQLVTSDGLFVADSGGGTPIQLNDLTTSFSISQDGTIVQQLSDGTVDNQTKVGVTKVINPEGLEKIGGSLYRATVNSGEEGAVNPMEANSTDAGTGAIVAGQLEMSNVDLTGEFTEMIVAQRGFQANSRIITTSDEVLQEVVNLKR